jgi:N utilization substance protein A
LNDVTSGGKTATVVVPEDQLSLAIGRDGQNARLAAKLTGWRIDIKSLPEAAGDSLNKLKTNEEYKAFAEAEASVIPSIEEYLQKKVEGRPLNPEEYDQLAKFVDRVEKKSAIKRQAEKKTEDIKRTQAMSTIEPRAFEAALDGLKLDDHISSLLLEAGYITEGELALQLLLNPDSILALQGIGPKAMTEIEAALQKAQVFVVEEVETEKVVEVEPEVVIETKPTSEPVLEKVNEPEVEEVEVLPVEVPVLVEEEELTTDLNKLFELNPDVLVAASEEDDDELQKKDAGKKKKKKHVEITYDPDRDLTVVKKIHKRGADGGQDDWDE